MTTPAPTAFKILLKTFTTHFRASITHYRPPINNVRIIIL